MGNTSIRNFVSENLKTIFAYSLNRLSNQADAEDLTSEIILALLTSAERKICGNILVSAYYAPVSVQELSLELGISTAYLEDELDLLMRHKLVIKDGRGKYQTNIIVFTEDYANELIEKTKYVLERGAKNIYTNLSNKINDMKQVKFYGNDFNDNQLL